MELPFPQCIQPSDGGPIRWQRLGHQGQLAVKPQAIHRQGYPLTAVSQQGRDALQQSQKGFEQRQQSQRLE
jgi:hypothetical protein